MENVWSNGAAWMDGTYMPAQDAKISVLDWGFTRSDVTYDVVHVWNGSFFRLDDHLDRFQTSMQKVRMSVAQSRDDMKQILNGVVAHTGLQSAYVAMVTSRGRPGAAGSRDFRNCDNHFFAYAVPFIWVISPDIAERGAHMFVPDAVRRIPDDSIDPTAKNYHWGDFTRGLFEAKDEGYDSVILLDHDGNITEGAGFNVFAIKDGCVISSGHGALEGITRRTVMELCELAGLKIESRPLPLEEFLAADEVFLSTTAGGITPISKVNGRVFSNGAPGADTMRLHDLYWQWHAEGRYGTPVDYTI